MIRVLPALRPLGLLAVLLLLSGCALTGTATAGNAAVPAVPATASPAADRSSAPPLPPATATDVVTVVVVGDSITAGTGPTDRADTPGPQSWQHGFWGAPLEFRGGWAVPGATTEQMRAGAAGLAADVLVLLGGTNDLATGVGWPASQEHLLGVVAAVGEGHVVLSAIPPSDFFPALVLDFNARLTALAQQQGWEFVDPWVAVSQGGAFAPGTSPDGIHPTPEVAAQAGAVIRAAVLT
ncbi:SGNH/GDSL hydrolase family protein [Modestobacter sp. I12A-02662]|uniref:SGNH/GDSL hydrolase family protein n=1 Tax=Modestobacter sp. I12A-02662 TaxID=1730496 RepID=UPI0034DFB66A